MSLFDQIMESFLTEAVALTKGSQRVMNDKKLVAGLADAMRDDAASHPQNFPPNSKRNFQKAPDEELAQWFLENIDKIEREGYEGTVYSRDGVYSDWIVRRYIAGSHNWEDLIGVMNMNLRDWNLLKNRNMLDPNHKDLPKFNSVRDVGKYMTTHYHDKLADVRDASKNAALKKLAKIACIVDNEDYKIFTVFNWAGARSVGLGTQWCTANSVSDLNYINYSTKAMLFQLFPKNPDIIDKTGKVFGKRTTGPEKYQFDAGSPCFHDIADDPADKNDIKKKFPYIYSDLVKGLKAKSGELETAMEAMSQDTQLKSKETKTNIYNISEEIKKLEKLVNLGYFTDKVRPASAKQETLPAPEGEVPSSTGEEQMESIKELVAEMLGEKSSFWREKGKKDVEEVDEDDTNIIDPGVLPPSVEGGEQMATGGTMGGGAGPTGGGKYPPGTAPTMPESFDNKGNIMENVDKDVAAMLSSLKKYDTLKESVAPVMGMVTLGEKKGGKPEWLEDAEKKAEKKEGKKPGKGDSFKSKKEKDDKKLDEAKECKSCHCAPCECDDKKDEMMEGADQEVLNWMKRFSNLGNMKGYGR